MEGEYSRPITEFPSFLSTISMVVDDRSIIIKRLIQAERKSPPRYMPARDLFLRILEGDFEFGKALDQARKLQNATERKCATEVLRASEDFLRKQPPAHTSCLSDMTITLPNKKKLNIAPVWLRHLEPERLMVLHFWESPLNQRQLRAAAAALRTALSQHFPEFSRCSLDFISTSLPDNSSQRQFKAHSWESIKPLNDDEMDRFWGLLCDAWSEYKRRDPRKLKRRRELTLF